MSINSISSNNIQSNFVSSNENPTRTSSEVTTGNGDASSTSKTLKSDIVDISEKGRDRLNELKKDSQDEGRISAKSSTVNLTNQNNTTSSEISAQKLNQIAKKISSGAFVSDADIKLLKKNNPTKYKEAMLHKAQLQKS